MGEEERGGQSTSTAGPGRPVGFDPTRVPTSSGLTSSRSGPGIRAQPDAHQDHERERLINGIDAGSPDAAWDTASRDMSLIGSCCTNEQVGFLLTQPYPVTMVWLPRLPLTAAVPAIAGSLAPAPHACRRCVAQLLAQRYSPPRRPAVRRLPTSPHPSSVGHRKRSDASDASAGHAAPHPHRQCGAALPHR